MGDTQKDKNLELARQLQAAIEGATEYINTLKTEIGSLERESVPRQDPIQRTVLFFMRFPVVSFCLLAPHPSLGCRRQPVRRT